MGDQLSLGAIKGLEGFEQTKQLERLLKEWASAPIFYATKNEQVAERLVDITLCHTYLFGRFTLPSYAGHIFMSLRSMPPITQREGPTFLSNAAVFEGELFTNNVFERKDECHSHYVDLLEAYGAAGRDETKVTAFTRREREVGLKRAMQESPLWDSAMQAYAEHIIKATLDPLTTFLLVLASEDTIAQGYKTTLAHLHPSPRFDKYRTFMQRHILLDQQEAGHGDASVNWLNLYLERCTPTREEVNRALEDTNEFIERRIETYKIK